MATPDELKALLNESRNGSNGYFRHPLARRFIYTDGVEEMAELCGAYWLLDVIGTEMVEALLNRYHDDYTSSGLIEVTVIGNHCKLELTIADDEPGIWQREVEYTDFPPGHWVFKLGVDTLIDNGKLACVMCLLSED